MAESNNLTPEQRVLRARMAAHARWAKERDPSAATQPGREAFLKRFIDEVDPERELPEPERIRRAEHARAAYMTRLAFESSRKRSEQKLRKRERHHRREQTPVAEVVAELTMDESPTVTAPGGSTTDQSTV